MRDLMVRKLGSAFGGSQGVDLAAFFVLKFVGFKAGTSC